MTIETELHEIRTRVDKIDHYLEHERAYLERVKALAQAVVDIQASAPTAIALQAVIDQLRWALGHPTNKRAA